MQIWDLRPDKEAGKEDKELLRFFFQVSDSLLLKTNMDGELDEGGEGKWVFRDSHFILLPFIAGVIRELEFKRCFVHRNTITFLNIPWGWVKPQKFLLAFFILSRFS